MARFRLRAASCSTLPLCAGRTTVVEFQLHDLHRFPWLPYLWLAPVHHHYPSVAPPRRPSPLTLPSPHLPHPPPHSTRPHSPDGHRPPASASATNCTAVAEVQAVTSPALRFPPAAPRAVVVGARHLLGGLYPGILQHSGRWRPATAASNGHCHPPYPGPQPRMSCGSTSRRRRQPLPPSPAPLRFAAVQCAHPALSVRA